MAFPVLAKILEDRVTSSEQRFDKELERLDGKIDRNFKINILVACIGLIPALQAIGIPTNSLLPLIVKILLGQ